MRGQANRAERTIRNSATEYRWSRLYTDGARRRTHAAEKKTATRARRRAEQVVARHEAAEAWDWWLCYQDWDY